ncbi:MAG TPA: hypothetical protein VJK02_01970, partial [Anaerolineales bacterium]|nr:hypothetical protein [Anaerolineales bacterium]
DSPDDDITYTITVVNTGNVALNGIEVVDQVDSQLPVTLDNSTVAGDGTPGDPPTPNGILDVGETWTYTFIYDVPQSDIDVIGHLEWRAGGMGAVPGTANGALFFSGSDYPATGSGLIDSFVRIQANDDEQGYNTDFRPQQFNEGNTATFNHSILVSEVPVITINGQRYLEFRLDTNELNSRDNALLSLDAMQIYVQASGGDTGGSLTDFDQPADQGGTGTGFDSDATLLFDLDSGPDGNVNVILNDWSTGSGHGDYAVLVPILESVELNDDDFIYLYSAFGGAEPTDGGFEEWYLRKFGLLENTARVTATFTDDAGNTKTVSDEASVGVVVSAAADYEITEITARIASATGSLPAAGVTYGTAATVDNAIEYTLTIRNDGNVTLSNVVVTEQLEGGSPMILDNSTVSGDDGNGKLDLGETWTYAYTRHFGEDGFDLNGDLRLTSTIIVDSDETHPLSGSTEVDITSMIFTGMALQAHPASWWASHTAAWDGNLSTNQWDGLVGSALSMRDVLIAVDSNRNGNINASDPKGIMIGDVNANGLTDAGETTLFVPLAAAQQLIAASDTPADLRQLLMREALAAQLNINNMSGDSALVSSDAEGPNNIVSEAAMWLRGLGPYTYGTNSTGKVDTNGDGSLSAGTSTSSEYNTSTRAFSNDANGALAGKNLTASLAAWSLDVDVDSTSSDIRASGLDLKNGLQQFNAGHLVVSQSGGNFGWFDGAGFVDVGPNTPDAFWNVLFVHVP